MTKRMNKLTMETQITWLDSGTPPPCAGERVLVSDGKTVDIKTRMKGIAETGYKDYWASSPLDQHYEFWALLPSPPKIEKPIPISASELTVVADKPSLEQARESFLKNGPTLTDHCLLQNFSRAYGVPVDELRQDLLQKVTKPIMDAHVFKGKVTVEGITYVIESGKIVTCYEKTKNKPKPKGKSLKKAKGKQSA